MKQVLVFPRGQLTDHDRALLEAAEILAVEADDPKAVVVHIPMAPIASESDLFMAAMAGVTCGSSYDRATVMVNELNRRVKAREQSGGTQ
jgi:hypothetical protein